MSATTQILLILLAGIGTVIGSILMFRLHAFLALVLGGLLVGLLTPRTNLQNFLIEDSRAKVLAQTEYGLIVDLEESSSPVGSIWLVTRQASASDPYEEVGRLRSAGKIEFKEEEKLLIAFDESFGVDDLQTNDVISAPASFESSKQNAARNVGSRLAAAFGSTAGQIGILIALASIIGKCLLDSGGADRIVRSSLSRFGEEKAPHAFLFSGFLLAIPVFFDTVFYLMIPLGKALHLRTGKNYLLYVLTIVAGGTMAHSLVPPTPGPLFVAEALGVGIGVMILAGCGVGVFTSTAGFFYAHYMNRRNVLPLRETPDISLEELGRISSKSEEHLPPLTLSLLPILLPVALIGGYTIVKPFLTEEWARFKPLLETLGDKNIAIAIGAVCAIGLLVKQTRLSKTEFSASMQSALAGAGVIILITSAGGAFGQMLKMTGVASLVRELPFESPTIVLLLAFLVTTAIRTAQGSSTVAMITAVGLFAPIVSSGQLGVDPVYVALAIGSGSKPLAWMNDSGFWVITRMSGMTEQEGLKYITHLSGLMCVTGLAVTIVAALIFPGV
jgi:gluconate:H+ symporter, GntP family